MSKYAITAYVVSLAIICVWIVWDVPLPVAVTALFIWGLGSVAALAAPNGKLEPAPQRATRDDVR